jgi:hypothetical protein
MHPEQVLSAGQRGWSVRPSDVEDWIAINNLVNSYPHALDGHDAELFRTLWHPDGVWDFGDEYGVHRGVDDMLAFLSESWGIQDGHHLVTNVVIDLREDGTASGRSVAYAQVSRHDGVTLFPMIASYRDDYVRHEGRWVFKSRQVRTDHRAVDDSLLEQHTLRRSPSEV